jgi:hypothetical protein
MDRVTRCESQSSGLKSVRSKHRRSDQLTAARDGIRKIGTPGQLKIYDVRKLTEARSNAGGGPHAYGKATPEMATGSARGFDDRHSKSTIISVKVRGVDGIHLHAKIHRPVGRKAVG